MPPTQSNTPFYLDKGLWVALLGMFLPVISTKLGVQLSADKIAGIVVLAVGFIVAHKAKSGAVLVAEIRTRALAAVSAATPTPNEGAAK